MRHICLFDSSLSSWNFFYPMKTEPNNLMGKIQTAEFLFTLQFKVTIMTIKAKQMKIKEKCWKI